MSLKISIDLKITPIGQPHEKQKRLRTTRYGNFFKEVKYTKNQFKK
jgi:hypothetical protein